MLIAVDLSVALGIVGVYLAIGVKSAAGPVGLRYAATDRRFYGY